MIDAHQHYWRVDRGDYGWLKADNETLYRDYLPEDLKPILHRLGIDKTVAVQAAPTIAETEFLLALAEEEPTMAGVVGWLDLESETFERDLSRLRQHPKFVGLRPMIQDLPDGWVLRPRVRKNLAAVAERGVPFDFLVYPRHLREVLGVLEELPELHCVIDHLAKPNIKGGEGAAWFESMAELATHPNVYCKLSGMVTEADHEAWTVDDLRPYAEHIMRHFGERRVIFGSDWPVCLSAASYAQVFYALEDIVTAAGTNAAAVFGGNAARFYRLA